MTEYSKLLNQIFMDNAVITENGLKDRKLLTERFIIPLVRLSSQYIPQDYNAIEVNDIANEVHSSYIDIEHITSIHINAVRSNLKILTDAYEKIECYLN